MGASTTTQNMVEYDFGFKKMEQRSCFLGGSSIDSIEVEAVGLRNGCYDKKELSWLFLGPAKMETRCYSASGS